MTSVIKEIYIGMEKKNLYRQIIESMEKDELFKPKKSLAETLIEEAMRSSAVPAPKKSSLKDFLKEQKLL